MNAVDGYLFYVEVKGAIKREIKRFFLMCQARMSFPEIARRKPELLERLVETLLDEAGDCL